MAALVDPSAGQLTPTSLWRLGRAGFVRSLSIHFDDHRAFAVISCLVPYYQLEYCATMGDYVTWFLIVQDVCMQAARGARYLVRTCVASLIRRPTIG